MATTAPSPKPVAITIPADYLEDVRTALIAEIENDGNAHQTNQAPVTTSSRKEDLDREDRASSVRLLRYDVRLLDQLLDASGQTRVSADPETLSEVLQSMVRVLSSRLVDECGLRTSRYGGGARPGRSPAVGGSGVGGDRRA